MKAKKDNRTKKFVYKWKEPKAALNIALRKLEKSELKARDIICEGLTLQELMTAIITAGDFIDYAKFTLGGEFIN